MKRRISHWVRRHEGLLVVTLLALAVRLVWNLVVHPPMDHVYSDMLGYVDRANALVDKPWKPDPYSTFFPYGTHVFLYLIKVVFGRDNRAAVGVAFALTGTLAVSFTYALAARYTARPWVRRAVASVMILYYPWISLGGYALSEIPFTLCVAAAAFFGLRLLDRGRPIDAWLLGAALALGTTVRPQMLVSVALLGLHFVLRRRAWRSFTRALVPRVALPIAIVLAVSAWRYQWHMGGEPGLVSSNGPLNFAFGRCHATTIHGFYKGAHNYFGPPPLGALYFWETEHPDPIIGLHPAMGPIIMFHGRMWDAAQLGRIAKDCVALSGWPRQASYAVTHVVLLWLYNVPWPDQGSKILAYRVAMIAASAAHAVLILPPALVALALSLQRRRARSMVIALHVWAVVAMAVIYFGDTRYRAPYDGILVLLAMDVYATWLRRIAARFAGRRRRAALKPARDPGSARAAA